MAGCCCSADGGGVGWACTGESVFDKWLAVVAVLMVKKGLRWVQVRVCCDEWSFVTVLIVWEGVMAGESVL